MTETQQEQSSWFDIKERLPFAEEAVLVWRGFIDIGLRESSNRWYSAYDHSLIYGVTHWQPLPARP